MHAAPQEEAYSCSQVSMNRGGGAEREGVSVRELGSKFWVEVAKMKTKTKHRILKAKLPGPEEKRQAGQGR